MTLEDIQRQARIRWRHASPYRVGILVGELDAPIACPYRPGSRGASSFAQGVEAGRERKNRSTPEETTMTEPTKPARKRGFQLQTPERMREIAALGGRTAHSEGRAHRFSPEEARAAARKSVAARAAREASRQQAMQPRMPASDV